MPVNLSIKNASDEIVQSPGELLAEVRRLCLHMPADSAAIVGADRDRH